MQGTPNLPITTPPDALGRPLRDLRISITDRCNFRCRYCMPREVFGSTFRFLDRAELLTFEEIGRLARIFAAMGVRKIRLTGGEPLVRREVERLVATLAAIPGDLDLALTTNGALLPRLAGPLRDAGLHRVTVSLDSLDDATFMAMNDAAVPVARVLEGIDAAVAAGFGPVKLNMVVQRGVNDGDILPMARFARDGRHTLRYIEYMDVGNTNGWQLRDVVPADEIVAAVDAAFPLAPIREDATGAVAMRWRYLDGAGEIGVIASVTRPFCAGCTRARLSPEGSLYTCLFATDGHDLRRLLRAGADDDAIHRAIADVWGSREDRYSDLRALVTLDRPKVEMSHIGG